MLAHKDQDNIADFFPVQSCSWAMGQHCTSNFLVQCCLRRIWTTLTRQYSYAMLSCPSMVDTTLSRLFFHKNCLFAMGQHYTGDFLVQCWPRKIQNHCRLFSSAKLFVDCAMIGGWNDRSTGSKQIYFF